MYDRRLEIPRRSISRQTTRRRSFADLWLGRLSVIGSSRIVISLALQAMKRKGENRIIILASISNIVLRVEI